MTCIDIQINGYFGIDFNADSLTVEQLELACLRLQRDGVSKILATVITAPVDAMCRRIRNLARAIATNEAVAAVVAGIHVEGPFLSPLPGYVGAHPVESILPADLRVCQQLCAAGEGWVRMVTMAPEVDPTGQVIRFLATQQIVVAAGHTNATRDELRRSIDHGLRAFTHLGNGCPLLLPRHDNIIHRVLSLADHLTISLIADGHHLPGFVLSQYLRLIPPHQVVIVSDAISAAGLGPGRYPLGQQEIEVDSAGIAWAANRQQMAGSTGVLSRMATWLQEELDCNGEQVRAWCYDNPIRLIGAY